MVAENPTHGHKHYLQVLNLAAIGNEHDVSMALQSLIERNALPNAEAIKLLLGITASSVPMVNITQPQLATYDALLSGFGVHHEQIH